ncbi:MAG TPA: BTAD domain-containing putative transcriptional regulator [Acidimicrobiales bacterium]|nr:BTAD domain-containing putative transcriptional regulator [Acidimicrobiales bacterium]
MEYRILGPLALVRDGAATELGGLRQRALLARLVLARGQVLSVERLIDDLWGGAPPPAANGTLQSYVSTLRRTIEPQRAAGARPTVLLTAPPGYQLVLTNSTIDADEFEDDLRTARNAQRAGDLERAEHAIATALARWRGDALGEFAHEPWALAEAARLTELREAAIEDRVDVRLNTGQHHSIVAELESLVASAPLRERRRGQLMLALYRSGRQADALRTYGEGRERLLDELGLDPGHDLQRLEQLILQQSPELDLARPPEARPPAAAPASASGTRPRRPLPTVSLVGREREMRAVEPAIDDLLNSRGRIVLLAGEAGIGKSRLADEIIVTARSHKIAVLEGHGYAGEGAPSYWPWLQVLRPLITAQNIEQSPPALFAHAPALAQIMPELKELIPGLEPATAVDADTARFELASAIVAVLSAFSIHRPLLVVLDDLHWSDESSLFVLRFAADAIRRNRIMVLGTYRPDEPYPALKDTLAALARHQDLLRIELSGIAVDDVIRVLDDRLGADVAATIAADVHARTSGNPFFVQEIARSLEHVDLVELPHALATVPAGVRDVLGRSVAALPSSTQRVLEVAAVAGRGVDLRLLNSITGDALDHVEAALAERVLIPVAGSLSQLRFRHDLLRETILSTLTPIRRARLHGDIGRYLETSQQGQLDEVAEHFWQAAGIGFEDDAVRTALAAADQNLERLIALERTEEHLNRALSLLERLPSTLERHNWRLRGNTRLVQLMQRRHGLTAPQFREALQRMDGVIVGAQEPPELVGARTHEWGFHVVSGHLAEARAIGEDMLAHAALTNDDGYLLGGSLAMGNTLHHLGDHAGSLAHIERAVELALASTDFRTRFGLNVISWSYGFSAAAHLMHDHVDRAYERIDKAIDAANRDPNGFDQTHAYFTGAWVAGHVRDVERGLRYAEPSFEIALRDMNSSYDMWSGAVKGWAMARMGDATGEPLLSDCIARSYDANQLLILPMLIALWADVALARGDHDRAHELIAESFALGRRTGEVCYEPELHRLRAELLHRAGDADAAHDELAVGMATAQAHGAILYQRILAETAAEFGIAL